MIFALCGSLGWVSDVMSELMKSGSVFIFLVWDLIEDLIVCVNVLSDGGFSG